MAYCRFGQDSDVYCYHSIFGGWDVLVAKYASSQNRDAPQVPFNMPKAGEYFRCPTIQETITTLRQLKEEGYKVPSSAIDRLIEELAKRLVKEIGDECT